MENLTSDFTLGVVGILFLAAASSKVFDVARFADYLSPVFRGAARPIARLAIATEAGIAGFAVIALVDPEHLVDGAIARSVVYGGKRWLCFACHARGGITIALDR